MFERGPVDIFSLEASFFATANNCLKSQELLFKKSGKNYDTSVTDDCVKELEPFMIYERPLVSIDDALVTENVLTNISKPRDGLQEMPEYENEGESGQQDDNDTKPYYSSLTSIQAVQKVGKKKYNFINKKYIIGGNLIYEIQTRVESTSIDRPDNKITAGNKW